MSYNKILNNIKEQLEDYRDGEFTECDLESLVLALESINGDFKDTTTDEEFALYNECESKVGEAEMFFEAVYQAEATEQCLDEMRYESAKHVN